jgi:hypothetical protein
MVMNTTMIYCKNFCKFHSVYPVQQLYDDKKLEFGKRKKEKRERKKVRKFSLSPAEE